MIIRRLLLLVLVLLLVTVQTLPAAAQPPQPMLDDAPPLAQDPVESLNDTSPFGRPEHSVAATPEAVMSPNVVIGQPGLSYRYVQTFGQTGIPYPVDTQHLNRPNGLAVEHHGRGLRSRGEGPAPLEIRPGGLLVVDHRHAGPATITTVRTWPIPRTSPWTTPETCGW